jgi:hypothetical protein
MNKGGRQAFPCLGAKPVEPEAGAFQQVVGAACKAGAASLSTITSSGSGILAMVASDKKRRAPAAIPPAAQRPVL